MAQREGKWVDKEPRAGNQSGVARGVVALHCGALSMRLSALTMKICLILVLFLHGTSSVSVILNHPYSLPCGHGEKVVWRKIAPIKATVAECQNEKCIVKESLAQRFTVMHEKNNSLFLKSAKYNDQGQYVCSCDGIDKHFILEVVVPINVTAVELENITLPCYADTQSNVRDVTWLHNEKTILHYTTNGGTNPGNGYEDRVSLTEDGFRDGEISLTIMDVQKTDEGLHRCLVHDETTKGEPYAYMLHVNEKPTNAGGNQTEGNTNEKRMPIGLIFSFLVIISFFLFLCCKKTTTAPGESQSTADSEPVQESDQTHSTQPFYSPDKTHVHQNQGTISYKDNFRNEITDSIETSEGDGYKCH